MTTAPVENDPGLLELFIGDMDRQSDLWKPTNYWRWQCRRMQVQLQERGLAGFRRNWDLMRGVDLGPKQAGVLRRPLFKSKAANWLARQLPWSSNYEAYISDLVADFDAANKEHIGIELSLLFHLLKQGEYSGPICSAVTDSGVGDPYLYEFDGRMYSSNLLHQICLVSLLFRTGGAGDYRRILEIGGGYGALPETMLKLLGGEIEYFVEVDIPPLVYVTTQYLKAAFPGKVIDYRQVRGAAVISPADIKGKILVIPPWTVPALDLQFDLFWNSASFQEMERDVVDNYLEYICKTSDHLFINTLTDGHRKGLGGQLEPISFQSLASQIRAKGYRDRPRHGESVEQSAYRSVLPRHTAALFTRGN